MPAFTHAIFDLDGTLIESLTFIHHSVNDMLRALNLPEVTIEQTKDAMGLPLDDFLKKLIFFSFSNNGNPIEEKVNQWFDRHYRGIRSNYTESYTEESKHYLHVYDGVKEGLTELQAAGVNLAIVTNRMVESAKTALALTELDAFFPVVVGNGTFTTTKPDPSVGMLMKNGMGFDVSKAVMIGDGEADYDFAVALAIPAVTVLYGMSDEAQARSWGATTFANRFSDAVDYILRK